MIFSFLFMLKIFDIENIQINPEWISKCIRGSFKSPNEYPNICVVVLESEYFRIRIYSLGIIRISECIWIFVTLWFFPSPPAWDNLTASTGNWNIWENGTLSLLMFYALLAQDGLIIWLLKADNLDGHTKST